MRMRGEPVGAEHDIAGRRGAAGQRRLGADRRGRDAALRRRRETSSIDRGRTTPRGTSARIMRRVLEILPDDVGIRLRLDGGWARASARPLDSPLYSPPPSNTAT